MPIQANSYSNHLSPPELGFGRWDLPHGFKSTRLRNSTKKKGVIMMGEKAC
jgi:hypothetical protein